EMAIHAWCKNQVPLWAHSSKFQDTTQRIDVRRKIKLISNNLPLATVRFVERVHKLVDVDCGCTCQNDFIRFCPYKAGTHCADLFRKIEPRALPSKPTSYAESSPVIQHVLN